MSVPSRGVSSAWMGTLVACSLVAVGLLEYRRRRSRRRWPHGVEVRPSRVPGGGDGLFATRPFAPGEAIGEYRGRVLSLRQAQLLENRDYLMGFGCAAAHARQPRRSPALVAASCRALAAGAADAPSRRRAG